MTYKNLVLFAVLCVSISIFSCRKNIEGCTDPKASNYDAAATKENGTCLFEKLPTDTTDTNQNPVIIRGCTNPIADNYNPQATQEDGSCIISGCMDPDADNYNPLANKDNGSCIDKRLKFSGAWTVTHDCAFPYNLAASQTVTYDTTVKDTIIFSPFLGGSDLKATVSGFTVNIPNQSVGFGGAINVNGNGTLNSQKTEMNLNLNFTSTVPFIQPASCSATYKKQ
jgi:hypothetical protein